jgi:hypothetical protein
MILFTILLWSFLVLFIREMIWPSLSNWLGWSGRREISEWRKFEMTNVKSYGWRCPNRITGNSKRRRDPHILNQSFLSTETPASLSSLVLQYQIESDHFIAFPSFYARISSIIATTILLQKIWSLPVGRIPHLESCKLCGCIFRFSPWQRWNECSFLISWS